MQTNILAKNIRESVSMLDNKRLFSNIYENIHGLAALLGCVDKLEVSDKAKKQIKKKVNKSQVQLWKGYEEYLLSHIITSYIRWFNLIGCKNNMFNETVNYRNISILIGSIANIKQRYCIDLINIENYPDWVSEVTLITHKLHLVGKEIPKHKKALMKVEYAFLKYHRGLLTYDEYQKERAKYEKKLNDNLHYRKMFGITNKQYKELKDYYPMRYDWK